MRQQADRRCRVDDGNDWTILQEIRMLRNTLAGGIMVVLAWGVCSGQTTQPSGTASRATTAPDAVKAEGQSPGMAALAKASAGGKYVFIFFSKENDDKTVAMRKVVDGAVAKATEKATTVAIDINSATEKEIVAKYGVAAAPMPLVLAIAPNGAITGGFPITFEEKELLDAFASPGTEKCLKALQSRKLVLLCAQNKTTTSNDAASKGAEEFKADKRFAEFTEIILVDPADAAEAKFMTQLHIAPKTGEAVTVLLAPPGSVVCTVKGKVDKEALATAVTAAASNSGCGPGGCGPGGCGPQVGK